MKKTLQIPWAHQLTDFIKTSPFLSSISIFHLCFTWIQPLASKCNLSLIWILCKLNKKCKYLLHSLYLLFFWLTSWRNSVVVLYKPPTGRLTQAHLWKVFLPFHLLLQFLTRRSCILFLYKTAKFAAAKFLSTDFRTNCFQYQMYQYFYWLLKGSLFQGCQLLLFSYVHPFLLFYKIPSIICCFQ